MFRSARTQFSLVSTFGCVLGWSLSPGVAAADDPDPPHVRAAQQSIQAATEFLRMDKLAVPGALSRRISSDEESSEVVLTALRKPVSVEFIDMELAKTIEQLSKTAEIPIVIDTPRLSAKGIRPSEPISVVESKLSLAELLGRILTPLGLDYVVSPSRLVITTREAAHEATETRLYDLRSLPAPLTAEILAGVARNTVRPGTWRPAIETMQTDLPATGDVDSIVSAIKSNASEPAADAPLPQVGGIAILPGLLVITHSQRAHGEIEKLFIELQTFYGPHGVDAAAEQTPEQQLASLHARLDLASKQIVRLQRTNLDLITDVKHLTEVHQLDTKKVLLMTQEVGRWKGAYREMVGRYDTLDDQFKQFDQLAEEIRNLAVPDREEQP